MKLLGFDCAGRGCAAAVLRDGTVLARRSTPMERGQAQFLIPMIETVLREAGLAAADLDLIAATVGPGAFTGLRIGLAAAHGLALATGKPALGVTSFAAVAAAVPAPRRAGRTLVVALDSKREELFLQAFATDGTAQGDGALVSPQAAAAWVPGGPLLLAGDGASRLAGLLAGPVEIEDIEVPDPADIARLGEAAWRAGGATASLRPLYLRAPDTTLPRPARGAG